MNRFWMVWKSGTVPVTRHDTHAKAKVEAARLAHCNPGQEFYVLEANGRAIEPTGVVYESLKPAEPPF